MERKLNLGVIGLGGRAASLLGVFRRVHSGLRVAAVADPDGDGARQRLRGAELPERDTAFFADAGEMLGHAGDLDALMIGTRCNIHTPMAVKAASDRASAVPRKAGRDHAGADRRPSRRIPGPREVGGGLLSDAGDAALSGRSWRLSRADAWAS